MMVISWIQNKQNVLVLAKREIIMIQILLLAHNAKLINAFHVIVPMIAINAMKDII